MASHAVLLLQGALLGKRMQVTGNGAIAIFGLVVAGTMELVRRWHRHNLVHHKAEVDHLLAVARSDGH